MNFRFNKRKWWNFKGGRSISIEICGWRSSPSVYFKADGDERDISFHLALGFGIWITFERFIPYSWYPKYESKTYGKLPEEREVSLSFHGGCFWWNFWVSEEWSSWTKNKTWRKGNFDFIHLIKGKHKYERNEICRQEHVLPFYEGNYNVEVIKFQRIDRWQRWPTSKSFSWEVRAGYYKDGVFVDKPIPVEGKGENSWDCDEDATWSISFPGVPYKKEIQTPYDAALYFWHSMMKSRERRGSHKWVPKAFKNKPLTTIK